MAQGVDNFLYELSLDGSTANFKFWDADDLTNTQEVNVSAKEFPEGVTQADSREVADYAYSLVAESMNAKRSDRIKAATVAQAEADQDRDKAERAATASHLNSAQDVTTAPNGTETREDGVKQNVYSSTVDSAPSKDSKKK